jgi:hypothetical protein
VVLNSLYGNIQFVCNFFILHILKAAQLENGAALFGQFIQRLPEFIFQLFAEYFAMTLIRFILLL